MSEENLHKARKYNKWIWILSILLPLAILVLSRTKIPNVAPLDFLPAIYATMNGVTAVLLVAAVLMIRKGNRFLHEVFMKSAIVLSILFLLMYVAYHMTSEPTTYGGEGVWKYFYYFILITHIILSAVVIPFVLITYVRAITGQFGRHKKIARFTFPLWLYVAITGVIVYLMISPYY